MTIIHTNKNQLSINIVLALVSLAADLTKRGAMFVEVWLFGSSPLGRIQHINLDFSPAKMSLSLWFPTHAIRPYGSDTEPFIKS